MSSKLFFTLLLGSAIFGGLVWAHYRYDAGAEAVSSPSPTAMGLDATPAFRRLMREGLDVRDEVAQSLFSRGYDDEARDLTAILPTRSEPWVSVIDGLLASPPKGPYPVPQGVEIVEPRDLRVAGHLQTLVRRAMPGRVHLEIAGADGVTGEAVTAEVPIGRWENLPETAVFQPGRRYVVRAREGKTGPVLAENHVQILAEAEEEEFRRKLDLLKKHVPDLRMRLYGQAMIAMSGGLYAEAARILFRQLPPGAPNAVEAGLDARLAYLHHRRGSHQGRDQALDRLRRARLVKK